MYCYDRLVCDLFNNSMLLLSSINVAGELQVFLFHREAVLLCPEATAFFSPVLSSCLRHCFSSDGQICCKVRLHLGMGDFIFFYCIQWSMSWSYNYSAKDSVSVYCGTVTSVSFIQV